VRHIRAFREDFDRSMQFGSMRLTNYRDRRIVSQSEAGFATHFAATTEFARVYFSIVSNRTPRSGLLAKSCISTSTLAFAG
jgi:hypothetical protein